MSLINKGNIIILITVSLYAWEYQAALNNYKQSPLYYLRKLYYLIKSNKLPSLTTFLLLIYLLKQKY